MEIFISLLLIIIVILFISIRQVNQYERGIVFMFGRFHVVKQPGWRIVMPIVQSMTKIDIRVKAVDLPEQKAITKDNIPVGVNAVIYYKVVNAEKAMLEIENYYYAVSQLAQTTMRNIVGEVELDQLLSERDRVSDRIKELVATVSGEWGITVDNVELKDVVLPPDLERTISKQAEAERERRSTIIVSEGEVAAAENIAQAARLLSDTPGGLHLRTLQTINDLSSDQSNTVIFAIPLEILRAFDGFNK